MAATAEGGLRPPHSATPRAGTRSVIVQPMALSSRSVAEQRPHVNPYLAAGYTHGAEAAEMVGRCERATRTREAEYQDGA